jgi:hypothetical protein
MSTLRAAFAAALACGALAAPASAAPYSVWSCRDALGAPLPTGAWIPAGNPSTLADTCADGGSLDVRLNSSDTAPGAVAGYRFDVPRGVTIRHYTAWLAAETDADDASPAPYVAGLGQGDELELPTVRDGCTATANSCRWGTFSDPLAPENEVTRPVPQDGLALVAACAGTTERCAPDANPPARAALFRSVVELDDPSAPAVGAVGGTVAAPAAVSGIRTVVADVSDGGSGVRRAELLLDGAVVDAHDQPGTCSPPYTVADPCPRSLRAAFALDTATLREGAHSVAVRAVDAAGNDARSAPITVDVVHPAPPPPPPPPPPVVVVVDRPIAPVALRLATPRRVRLPVSRTIAGTATAADGTPLAGIQLRFQRRPFGGGEDDWRDLTATAVTDAAGRFALPVPDGSAQIRALAPAPFAAAPAVTDFVRPLAATIRASRRTLRNGERLTLAGRLRHAGPAADDRIVLIQSRVDGRWRTVDSTETGARGRIRWRYRFTRTRRTARYRFRFVVPRAKRLPWSRVVTRQVSVLVRGG